MRSVRVRFVIGTEFKNWRRARVQDNTASWISRSPTFVSSRMLRRVCAISSSSRALSDSGEFVEVVEYRAQLGERAEATMGSLRKQPENAVASSWQASAPAPFYSRHPQCSMPNGISVYVSALPWVPEPSLPASVLLLVTLLDRPVLWASDLAQAPSPS
jgi:hypothetical protein